MARMREAKANERGTMVRERIEQYAYTYIWLSLRLRLSLEWTKFMGHL